MWSCWPREKRSLSSPPPSPSLLPLTRCGAGDWMWSRWPRETRSLSSPLVPLLTHCGADDWSCWQVVIPPPPPSFSLPPSHPLPCGRVTGCGRAGRVKQGRYHPPPPGRGRDWTWPCSPRETRSLSGLSGLPPSPSPLTRCEVGDWSC